MTSYACIAQVQLAVYSRAQVTVGGVPVQLPALVPSLVQVLCAVPLVMVGANPVTQL